MCNGSVTGKSLVVEFEELRGNQVTGAFLAKELAIDSTGRQRWDQTRQSKDHGEKFRVLFLGVYEKLLKGLLSRSST